MLYVFAICLKINIAYTNCLVSLISILLKPYLKLKSPSSSNPLIELIHSYVSI